MKRRPSTGLTLTSLCGAALATNLLLVGALFLLLAIEGGAAFWPRRLSLIELGVSDGGDGGAGGARGDGGNGRRLLGEVHERQAAGLKPGEETAKRLLLRTGNRDVTGVDFQWIDASAIVTESFPAEALLLERLEWGFFFGYLKELRRGEQLLASGDEAWRVLASLHQAKLAERQRVRDFERGAVAKVSQRLERLRLAERRAAAKRPADDSRTDDIARQRASLEVQYETLAGELFQRREELDREHAVLVTASGEERSFPVSAIVRAVRPNSLSVAGKLRLYGARLWEFVSGEPRESNTEGGIFPAIFGTVMMVFLMTFAVAPFGVLAALYLREYAKQGRLVRLVRIGVNNLAGVPSIVFGVFGLGFFVYGVGGGIDRLFFSAALPSPTFGTGGILWAALTLALLTVPVVIVATEEGLAAVPRNLREGSLALGATKWETTWRVVLPAAAPGILTGLILAMARAAGEVAPLMIVGMVKLAPALPVDLEFPFVHLERKFMHLGFHIYDLGFQSPNVEAAKPLVFATSLLLILVVTAMNLFAIRLRNRLRRRATGSPI